MATKKQEAAIQLYANLMAEVKVRIDAMSAFTKNREGIPDTLVREFCFLQLRMICELIALGCLTAHGDIKATQSKYLKKAYNADKIIQSLEDLHPEFFPTPIQVESTPPNLHTIRPAMGSYLTKEGLLKLYGKCGDTLHRGNIKKLLSEKKPTSVSLADANQWVKEVVDLLRTHHIALLGGENVILCILHSVKTGGVQVAFAESTEKPER